MAWRIDASGDNLRRSTSLPASTLVTICAWIKVVNDRNGNFRCPFILETSGTGSFVGVEWSSSNTFDVIAGTIVSFGVTPTSATGWFFVAVTANGSGANAVHGYWAKPGDTSFNTATANGSSFTPAFLTFGNDDVSEWMDGRIAAIKVWDAELTQTELWTEMWSQTPFRRTNLHLFAPGFKHAELNDMSGNGKTLTANGTLTTEEGPPVPWRRGRPRRSSITVPAGAPAAVQLADEGLTYQRSVSW
jgi:hypothetical protein